MGAHVLCLLLYREHYAMVTNMMPAHTSLLRVCASFLYDCISIVMLICGRSTLLVIVALIMYNILCTEAIVND